MNIKMAQGITALNNKAKTPRFLSYLEKYFSVVALFLLSGSLIPLLRNQDTVVSDAQNAGDPIMQIIWSLLYVFTFVLIVIRLPKFFKLILTDFPLLLLISLATLSFVWSVEPNITIRRSIAMIGTTMFGVYLAMRYSLKEWLYLLAWALGLAASLSIIFSLFIPSLGIMHGSHEGAWRGIFVHKNIFGRMMVLMLITFAFLPTARKHLAVKVFFIIIAFILIVLSKSAGALIVVIALIILTPLYHALRKRINLAILLVLIAFTISASFALIWFESGSEMILNAVGRDATLTGRIPLWNSILTMIQERIWLGYGFGAFWLGWNGASARIWAEIGWQASHGHNGFLDLWLHLGLLGLLIYLWGFAWVILKAIKLTRMKLSSETIWPLAMLTFLVIYNFTGSVILNQNNLEWVLYLAIAYTVAIKQHKQHEEKYDRNRYLYYHF